MNDLPKDRSKFLWFLLGLFISWKATPKLMHLIYLLIIALLIIFKADDFLTVGGTCFFAK